MKKKPTRIKSIQFFRTRNVIQDMLRYDVAFACKKFPNVVAYPRFQRGRDDQWGGKPTVDRWQSFLAGFDAMPMTDAEIRDAGILATVETMITDGWYTIKDQFEHRQVSLKDYLEI